MKTRFVLLLIIFVIFTSCKQQMESRLATNIIDNSNDKLTGEYLGQTLPYSVPRLFAPGILSTGLVNRDITFTPDGDELYTTFSAFDYSYAAILCTKNIKGVWSTPKVVSFAKSPEYITIEPCLSHDGKKLFFASDRPVSDTSENADMNIWVVHREGNDWGEPILLDTIINTMQSEYYPSLTKNGTLYFTREEPSGVNNIYRSVLNKGSYTIPEKLPEQVNCGRNRFNAFISPDESFIIIPALGVEKDVTGVSYYISFRIDNNTWSKSCNMGTRINKDLGRGWSASLSPDGEYLFFMSSHRLSEKSKPVYLSYDFFQQLQTQPQNGNADIYWVNADFIRELKLMVLEHKYCTKTICF